MEGVRCWRRYRKTWRECVNGQYSRICGGTSYGQTSNRSVAMCVEGRLTVTRRGRSGRFQNKR